MKTTASLLAILALSLLPVRAQQTSPSAMPTVQLPGNLQRVLTDYEDAWQKKDAKALATLFAPNAFVLPNGSAPARGRDAIERHYTGSGGPLSLRPLAYATNGNLGYIIGAYGRSKDAPDEGKFTLVLTRDAKGRWLILSDMDNLNRR
ncbi:MAG TPA: SgcJ/EcaC family oxidoreductase [Candidatus Polarisedimenticolaceae bacterium]|nr:SgcJ/EcaC family oxidoreductase [Candidatus Polarisedimenticolaceae bacterium]